MLFMFCMMLDKIGKYQYLPIRPLTRMAKPALEDSQIQGRRKSRLPVRPCHNAERRRSDGRSEDQAALN
jgi:hypothetical protein